MGLPIIPVSEIIWSQNRPITKKSYSLIQCTYGCKHLWVSDKVRQDLKCPTCKSTSLEIIGNFINPALRFVKLQAVTFAGNRSVLYSGYKRDSLLEELDREGFSVRNVLFYNEGTVTNPSGEMVIFKFTHSRKTTDVYVGVLDTNHTLINNLIKCIAKDKKDKKDAPAPKPKPTFETMSDAVGQEVRVGDWVTCWSTKNLGFGKVEVIGEFTEWKSKIRGVRIRAKNKVLLPFKKSDQIFKLTEERAMLLMLEG